MRVRACVLPPVLCLASAVLGFACTSTDGTSSSSSSGASGTGGSTEAGATTCGVFGKAAGACEQCAVEKCCAEGKACDGDANCKSCFEATPATRPAGCLDNPQFKAASDCVNGPCTSACNGSSGGTTDSGPSCRAIPCSEGAAGDRLCKDQGCLGGCFFGGCNIF